MNYSQTRGAVKQYTEVRAHSSVEGVTPHRLIQLLMEGALEKINFAKGHMQRNEIEGKAEHIDWALSILEGLQISLDMDKGGAIAQNLDDLYDYMQRRLILANSENDVTILEEVITLLTNVKEGWDGIQEETRRMTSEQIEAQINPEKK